MSVSDLKKLIELAQKALTIGDLERAKNCYLQYLSVQHDIKCVIALGNIFLQEKRPDEALSLIHISEPTRRSRQSRMPSSA